MNGTDRRLDLEEDAEMNKTRTGRAARDRQARESPITLVQTARRACALWIERGRQQGRHVETWKDAIAELRSEAAVRRAAV